MNGWNYVEGNPSNRTDPAGHAICLWPNHWEEYTDPDTGERRLRCVGPSSGGGVGGVGGVGRVANPPWGGTQPGTGIGTGTGAQVLAWLALGICAAAIEDLLDPEPNVIVELGAGDYSNARAMKLRFPGAVVIATNLVEEWEAGRVFAEHRLVTRDTEWYISMYEGWQRAKVEGLIVGDTRPLENKDVPWGIANIVYSVFPYPGGLRYEKAFEFGAYAGRIARDEPGSIVAVTSGNAQVRDAFETGFHFARQSLVSSFFADVPGAPFGLSAPANNRWGELGEIRTRMFIQTSIFQ
jgi:hypothetical protein